jgi:hypothetical protein
MPLFIEHFSDRAVNAAVPVRPEHLSLCNAIQLSMSTSKRAELLSTERLEAPLAYRVSNVASA